MIAYKCLMEFSDPHRLGLGTLSIQQSVMVRRFWMSRPVSMSETVI